MSDINVIRPLAHLAGAELKSSKAYIDAVASPLTVGIMDARDFSGLGSDTVSNTTSRLQAAVNSARANGYTLQLPYGTINLEDTLKIGYGDVSDAQTLFTTCWIRGHGASLNDTQGTVFRSHSMLIPAINVQSSPFLTMSEFDVVGLNDTSGTILPFARRNISAYYVGGYTPQRYKPYVGIAVNAYGGTVAADRMYPNDPYGRGNGGGILFRNIQVKNFEAGYCLNPNGSGAGTGNSITIEGGLVQVCAYAYSFCDPNGRNVNLVNTLAGNCYTICTNSAHGAQNGYPPSVRGGEWNSCTRLIDMTSNVAAMLIEGLSSEEFHSLGRWGSGAGSPLEFRGCTFSLGATGGIDAGKESVHFVSSGSVKINATFGVLDANNPGVFNVAGDGNVEYDGCYFTHATPINKDWAVSVASGTAAGLAKFNGFANASSAANHESRGNTTGMVNAIDRNQLGDRVCIKPSTMLLSVIGATTGSSVNKVLSNNPGWVETSNYSSLSWDNTGKRMSFNTTADGETRVGDLIMWRLKTTANGLYTANGNVVVNPVIPLFKVISIGGSGFTLCQAIWDFEDIDQTYNIGRAMLVCDNWAPGTALNGTAATFQATWTTASATITTNVSANTVLRPNDFIQAAAGLPALTRVVSVSGTTVVLSKLPTANRTNEPLYFGQLVAF